LSRAEGRCESVRLAEALVQLRVHPIGNRMNLPPAAPNRRVNERLMAAEALAAR